MGKLQISGRSLFLMPNPRSKGFTTQCYFHRPVNQGIFSFQPLSGGCNLGIEEIVNTTNQNHDPKQAHLKILLTPLPKWRFLPALRYLLRGEDYGLGTYRTYHLFFVSASYPKTYGSHLTHSWCITNSWVDLGASLSNECILPLEHESLTGFVVLPLAEPASWALEIVSTHADLVKS